jgi:hypothetical protein
MYRQVMTLETLFLSSETIPIIGFWSWACSCRA